MSASIFGTDGVRGTPGTYPLDEETIVRLGAATVRVFGLNRTRLLVARDPRESGPLIERFLNAGVEAEGGTLVSAGVIPTPAAAFLASREFDGAFVISASHNPYPDNGIKLLTGDGEKASPELEARLSDVVADQSWSPGSSDAIGPATCDRVEDYLTHLRRVLPAVDGLAGSRIAVDCANGATSVVAPRVLRDIGLDVVALNVKPDGRNINEDCGSTHPEALQSVVLDQGCRMGVAFDGDGDRAILVDADGAVVDGDAVLFVCAKHLLAEGRLTGNGIVATVMSNIGLEIALRQAGILVHRCPVGDRSVREEMLRYGCVLGGEQSGHIIFSEQLPTGDGILTALSVLRVIQATGSELAELTQGLDVLPQVLLNVQVNTKPDLAHEPEIQEAIADAERILGDQGRVLVRYSGTESLLRVMIEGHDPAEVQQLAESIADRARTRLC